MNTARRYIYREILQAVLLVAIAFLSLFFFFDIVGDLSSRSTNPNRPYGAIQSVLYCLMLVPQHIYELLPIAVLIGSIFVMASLAQNSEFTILRTGGLGPWQALRNLLWLGAGFAVLTFATGDYIAPWSNQQASHYKAIFSGSITSGRTGAWLKENLPGQERILNVRRLTPLGLMQDVRIFHFNHQGALQEHIQADSATFGDGQWLLHNARHNILSNGDNTNNVNDNPTPPPTVNIAGTPLPPNSALAPATPQRMLRQQTALLPIHTSIGQSMVATALLKPERMSAIELFNYVQHLKSNHQSAQNYEIPFWRKVFYPLSCLVMVILALPFAYLHFRSGNIATAVFGGVVVGISFFLLNNVFGYIGNLRNWTPWLAAAIPSLIYTAISMGAFTWLVLRR